MIWGLLPISLICRNAINTFKKVLFLPEMTLGVLGPRLIQVVQTLTFLIAVTMWQICWKPMKIWRFQNIESYVILFSRRNFSLIARYSLKFTCCSLLVVKSLTHYSLQNPLVTCCRSYSLQEITRYSLQKITRYSLQKLLVAKNHSLLVAEVTRCRKSLVTRCEIRSFLVAEVAHCKKSLVTRCEICSLLVAKYHSSLKQSPAGIVCLISTKLDESFSFFNIIYFLRPKNSKLFQVNILRWNLSLPKHSLTQQYKNG